MRCEDYDYVLVAMLKEWDLGRVNDFEFVQIVVDHHRLWPGLQGWEGRYRMHECHRSITSVRWPEE